MKTLLKMLQSVFKSVSVALSVAVGLVVLALAIFIFRIFHALPPVASLKEFHHEIATEVYSDEGKKIGEFTTERRYSVNFESIPKHVIYAFLAAEDSKFYEHKGIDFTSIARAAVSNLVRGRFAQGGSTITQQVARGILLASRKKEITRKLKEVVLAFRMEKELSKNEILSLYLNEIYLGHGAYGIGAAAQNYFGKKVDQLSVAEGAMLAGLPQRPHEWDPFRNPGLAKRRQHYVLNRMVEEKFITENDGKQAQKEPLKLYALEDLNNTVAPYFTEYVRSYLMTKYGSENVLSQGFKVYTTVRVDFQKSAERALDRGLREADKRLGWRGVSGHLKSPEEKQTFLQTVHDDVVSQITTARVLPGEVEQNSKKLLYDMSFAEKKDSPYYGPTPVKELDYYKAVVQEVDDTKGLAKAMVGQTPVLLPLTTMEWVLVEEKPLKAISQILKVDDVIHVKVEKVDKKENVVLATLEQEPEIQGAFLAYEHGNGFVRAMVGGRNFKESKFNRALQAKRQVGSTFKPLMYAAAFDRGFSPSSIVTDAPLVFKHEGQLDADTVGEDWRPRNYSGKFEGDIPLRLALIRSMNIPTVKLLNEITIDYGIQYARTLGITANLPRDLSIGLGSWSSSLEEIMRAYAIFPRLGKPVELNYIRKVVDGSGKVLEEYSNERLPSSVKPLPPAMSDPTLAEQGLVISEQTAYVMTDMLRGVIREGTGRAAAVVPAAVAGKTGTSNDHRDAWFVGYTPYLMAGVWAGYDQNKPLDPGETGGKVACPIWTEFMTEAVKEYPKGEFPIPDDISFAYIDRETGRLASASQPNRVKVAFKTGTVPNSRGDNLPRIGEPGVRANAASETPTEPTTVQKGEETDDFIREGFEQ